MSVSEYQYVIFRAVDAPVSKKNLSYMEKQSSRAEITPWSFENEYNYGDFRGNALEMLRRGYDFHLHYANYGIRKLMIRLPNGFPDSASADKYLNHDSISLHPDKSGPGLILEISPNDESGELDQIFDFHELVENLIQLRGEIIEGDLRPLYLMNLIAALFYGDEEAIEAPVPYGLNTLTDAQLALAEFYGIGDSLLKAAANNIPEQKNSKTGDDAHAVWLRKQSSSQKDIWLGKLMADPNSNIRAEILTEFRSQQKSTIWPVVERNRKIVDLEADAEKKVISKQKQKKQK